MSATLDKLLNEAGEQEVWDWDRLPAQQSFLTCPSTFSMYSGGFCTGKTAALCAKVIWLMTSIPNNLGYLGRKDGKALRQTTMTMLLDQMVEKEWIKTHNSQSGMLTFTKEAGGSKLVYGDLKDVGDMKNHNLGFFAIDQAEEVEWNDWEFLAGRLRRKNPVIHEETKQRQYWVKGWCTQSINHRHYAIGQNCETCVLCGEQLEAFSEKIPKGETIPAWEMIIYPRFGFGVCNTEDPQHWIYQKFTGLPGEKSGLSKGLEGYTAFSATTYEGLEAGHADREYVNNLEVTYASNPLMYERYLLGKWVTAEGLVYPAFNKHDHVVHSSSKHYEKADLIDPTQSMFEYIDPGLTAPTAAGWVVIEECGCGCQKHNFWIIGEHYEASPVLEYHVNQIKSMREQLARPVKGTYMDAQAFSRTQVQKITDSNVSKLYSVAQLYIDQGIYCTRNQKDWDAGYMRINMLLNPDPDHRHPVTGQLNAPHLFVLSTCTNVIHEFLAYKWKKRQPGKPDVEEPIDKDDHHMDGLNGFLAGRPEHQVDVAPVIDTRPLHVKTIEQELDELTGMATTSFMRM